MQYVSAAVRFDNLRMHVAAKAPFVLDAFWSHVKKDPSLDSLWWNLCDSSEAGDDDNRKDWDTLRTELENQMARYLSPSMVEIIYDDARLADTHCQVAAMFGDDDELLGWQRMEELERMERHDEESARISAWRNEY